MKQFKMAHYKKDDKKPWDWIFYFLPVPTVGNVSSTVTYPPEIGGDPREMGTLRPWAKKQTGPLRLLARPMMQCCVTRPEGIAWP